MGGIAKKISPTPATFVADPPRRSAGGGQESVGEKRRPGDEGIEGRPELTAVTVVLHQHLMLGAGHDKVRSRAQPHRESLDRLG